MSPRVRFITQPSARGHAPSFQVVLISALEAEELAAGQDHAFGDKVVDGYCWEGGGQGGWLSDGCWYGWLICWGWC